MLRYNLPSFLPTTLVVMAILYLTWFPDPVPSDSIPMFEHADKLVHAIMMSGLAGVAAFDYRRSKRQQRLTLRIMLIITVLVMIFGAVDEWIQGLIDNGRSSDILDLYADWAGCLVSLFIAPPVVNRMFR